MVFIVEAFFASIQNKKTGHKISASVETEGFMKRNKRKVVSLFLCLTLIMTTCFGSNMWTKAAAAEETMRDMTSMQLVQDMTLGWNLGDSLDSCAADRDGDGVKDVPEGSVVDETLWGNVRTTPEIFQTLKNQGFNAVRIPVTWRDHVTTGPSYTIDPAWMNRVQEVVDYAYDLGMYVIINLHHDGGDDSQFGAWIRNAENDKEGVMEEYLAIWQQIAERFQGYSDRLIFESMNEVGFNKLFRQDEKSAYDLLNEMNQSFVDLIRSGGGNNPKRHLLIAGYWTDIASCCSEYYKMPQDPVNRCILSVHYYTPWQFCTTNIRKTWGTQEDAEEMQGKIDLLKEFFINKNIPVIVGEFGVGNGTQKESRLRFCSQFIYRLKQIGVPGFFWDNGEEFNRKTLKWRTEGLAEQMLAAAGVKQDAAAVPSAAPTVSAAPAVNTAAPTVVENTRPKKGDTIQQAGGIYRITKVYSVSTSKVSYMAGNLTYLRPVSTKCKKAQVLTDLYKDGYQYKVTAISDKAFKGCKSLTAVTVGANVQKIGQKAWNGCKKLKKISLSASNLKTVGKKAFGSIHKKAVILVPANKVTSYKKKIKAAATYKKTLFLNKTSLNITAGINMENLQTLKVIGTAKKVTWSSSDTKKVKVTQKGNVTGVAGGTAYVRAKIGKKVLKCKVVVNTVQPVPEPIVSAVPTASAVTASKAPAASAAPTWTPYPLIPEEIKAPVSKDAKDVEELTAVIQANEAGMLPTDPDDTAYQWEDGKLVGITLGFTYDEEEENTEINTNCPLKLGHLSHLKKIKIQGRQGLSAVALESCPELADVSVLYTDAEKFTMSQCAQVEELNISCNNIKTFTVKDADRLKAFNCGANPTGTLDLSAFRMLETLECGWMELDTLNLAGMQQLKTLSCSGNHFNTLDLSDCDALEEFVCNSSEVSTIQFPAHSLNRINCSQNALKELDLCGQETLTELYCTDNDLDELDLSKCVELKDLDCSNNRLSALDLTNLSKLYAIGCGGNQLTQLDVTKNPALVYFYCTANQLTQLDLAANPALSSLDCSGNPMLQLDVTKNPALTSLTCNNAQLSQLDLPKNPNLQELSCTGNQLVSLDLTGAEQIMNVQCTNNQLTELKLPANSETLEEVECDGNQLTELDIRASEEFYKLSCSQNKLSKLTISGCKQLHRLDCHDNQLQKMDLSNIEALIYLDCSKNQLSDLILPENGGICELYCQNNQLTGLDISRQSNLELLDSRNNKLSWIDAAGLSSLENVYTDTGVEKKNWECEAKDPQEVEKLERVIQAASAISTTGAVSADYTNSPQYQWSAGQIKKIDWSDCGMEGSLKLEDFSMLRTFICRNNALTDLDLKGCTLLSTLYCEGNKLTDLDLRNQSIIWDVVTDPDVSIQWQNGYDPREE